MQCSSMYGEVFGLLLILPVDSTSAASNTVIAIISSWSADRDEVTANFLIQSGRSWLPRSRDS